jgi:serine kinase of HPr protein (carbohydrate metabolism regulator)
MEREYERLPYEPLTQDVLGVPVRKVVIQVVAGRNIAVLVEAAVRNAILAAARHRYLSGVRRAPPPRDGKGPRPLKLLRFC